MKYLLITIGSATLCLASCHHSRPMDREMKLAGSIADRRIRDDIEALAAIDPEPAGAPFAVSCMRRASFVPVGSGKLAGVQQADAVERGMLDTGLAAQFFEPVRECIKVCGAVADEESYGRQPRSLAVAYLARCRDEFDSYQRLVGRASEGFELDQARKAAEEGRFVDLYRHLVRLGDGVAADTLRRRYAQQIEKAAAYEASEEVRLLRSRLREAMDQIHILLGKPQPRPARDHDRLEYLESERQAIQQKLAELKRQYGL